MNPTSIVGQVARSMNANQPVLDQQSSSAPTFDASLQPPAAAPMPNKSPATEINSTALHRHFQNQGMPLPQQLQNGNITLPVEDTNQQQPGVQVPVTEAEKLIGALEKLGGTFTKRLDLINKHEERMRDHLLPPQEIQQ